MNKLFYFINSDFINASDATISVKDLALQRAYGVFDFFKTVNYYPIFLDEHLNRFFNSAEILRLPVPYSKEELKTIIHSLIHKNNIAQSGIKITLTGGDSESGYTISKPNLIITQQAIQLNKAIADKGLTLKTYSHQRQLPSAKTIDYIMGIWLQPFIQQNNADDVLYHQNNVITECPRSNFFMIDKNNILITPKNNSLKGITRNKIIEIAIQKFNVEEKDITMEDIRNAKEAFLTSTTKQIYPVWKIDNIEINKSKTGEITILLFDELMKIIL